MLPTCETAVALAVLGVLAPVNHILQQSNRATATQKQSRRETEQATTTEQKNSQKLVNCTPHTCWQPWMKAVWIGMSGLRWIPQLRSQTAAYYTGSEPNQHLKPCLVFPQSWTGSLCNCHFSLLLQYTLVEISINQRAPFPSNCIFVAQEYPKRTPTYT